MRLFFVFLLGVLVFGIINNSSMFFLISLLFAIYLIFSIFEATKSAPAKMREFIDVKEPLFSVDKLKSPDNMLDNMLKDAGKVTKAIAEGEEPKNVGKAVLKATYKTIEQSRSIFKE